MPEPEKGQEGTEPQVEDNAPNPLDYYDRIDTSKAERIAGVGGSKRQEARGEPSKFQQFLERGRETLERAKATGGRIAERIGERYPEAKEVARLAGEFARAEGTERVAKAGARQVAGSAVPVIANTSMAIYDAWDTYRDFRQFVDQARKHSDIKPVKDSQTPKPFHELAQQQKEAAANKHVIFF